MIRDALEYLVGMAEPRVITNGEYDYCSKSLKPFKNPQLEEFNTCTLQGMLDYCDTVVSEENKIIIHVAGFGAVNCYSMNVDKWQRRQLYCVTTALNGCVFNFGMKLNIEEFIVGLRANFVPNDELEGIIKILGNVTENEVRNHADDGITQTVTAKSGINFKAEIMLPPVLGLAPYRTFTEIEQPESYYIFRVQKGEKGPLCCLHSCNDNMWKMEAINKIANWIEDNISKENKGLYSIIA